MTTLEFWKEWVEIVDEKAAGEEWPFTWRRQWCCSDGITTRNGDTKAEAAAHFGVPVGNWE